MGEGLWCTFSTRVPSSEEGTGAMLGPGRRHSPRHGQAGSPVARQAQVCVHTTAFSPTALPCSSPPARVLKIPLGVNLNLILPPS